MTKQKSLKQIFQWIIAGGNLPYFPLPGPNHIQILTPKCKILNVFWTQIVIKGELKNLIFSIGF